LDVARCDESRLLLRTRRERPRRRTAEKRDEIAPLRVLPSERAASHNYSLAFCDRAANEKWHTTGSMPITPNVRFSRENGVRLPERASRSRHLPLRN
jgi:hypothetical protein